METWTGEREGPIYTDDPDRTTSELANYVLAGAGTLPVPGLRHWYHVDHVGSITGLTNDAGILAEAYVYTPYGEHWTITGPLGGPILDWSLPLDVTANGASTVGNRFTYTGRAYDGETGFHYYRTRYYWAEAGRFISVDTIGAWGDPAEFGNGYAYVAGRAHAVGDPMGEGFRKWAKRAAKKIVEKGRQPFGPCDAFSPCNAQEIADRVEARIPKYVDVGVCGFAANTQGGCAGVQVSRDGVFGYAGGGRGSRGASLTVSEGIYGKPETGNYCAVQYQQQIKGPVGISAQGGVSGLDPDMLPDPREDGFLEVGVSLGKTGGSVTCGHAAKLIAW